MTLVFKYQFAILVALFVAATKAITSGGGDSTSSFALSAGAATTAILSLILGVLLMQGFPRKIWAYGQFRITLLFFLFALVSTTWSKLPEVTLFRSVSGLLFVLGALGSAKVTLKKNFYGSNPEDFLLKTLKIILFGWAVGQLLFQYKTYGLSTIFPLRAGAAALLAAFISVWSFWFFLRAGKIKDFFVGTFYFALCVSFVNFSALLSWYVGILSVLIIRRKFLFAALLIAPIFPIVGASVFWLNQNLDAVVFGKPGAAYLIGSGRFTVYELSFGAFLNQDILSRLTGLGYMADREILVGLNVPWGADLHQSALSALIGLGPIGLVLYLFFICKPFIRVFSIPDFAKQTSVIFIFVLHCMFSAYGISSSSFLYQPSLILLIYLYCLLCLTGTLQRRIW